LAYLDIIKQALKEFTIGVVYVRVLKDWNLRLLKLRALMNMVMNLQIPLKVGNI
jgi:hypothetical protein